MCLIKFCLKLAFNTCRTCPSGLFCGLSKISTKETAASRKRKVTNVHIQTSQQLCPRDTLLAVTAEKPARLKQLQGSSYPIISSDHINSGGLRGHAFFSAWLPGFEQRPCTPFKSSGFLDLDIVCTCVHVRMQAGTHLWEGKIKRERKCFLVS